MRFSKNTAFYFTKAGLNRVAVARHGVILWENEATGLKIVFKILF